jgi:hypothetical protein
MFEDNKWNQTLFLLKRNGYWTGFVETARAVATGYETRVRLQNFYYGAHWETRGGILGT